MIDLHAHLDLYPNPAETVTECVARDLFVLSVTTTPSAWTGTFKLTDGVRRIRTALGLHPQIAHDRHGELSLFEELLSRTRYVGEIGLDGGPEMKANWDVQCRVFSTILKMCGSAGGRIMTIHSRRAASPVLDLLASNPGSGLPVLHWFSGTKRELQRAIDQGCWFSVGPAMLNGQRGRDLAAMMPRDRILTESDGPFAQVDGNALSPWDVEIAEFRLASIWGISRDEVAHRLSDNLRQLTGVLPNQHLAP